MKKIDKFNLFLIIYIIINIISLLVTSFLYRYNIIPFSKYPYIFYIYLVINIITMIIFRKEYRKSNIDILLVLCFLFGVISTIFAYDIKVSIFGFPNRYEGLIQISYYLTILYLSSYVTKKDKKYIVYTILFTGVLEVFYGFLQVTNYYSFLSIKDRGLINASGLISHSNFYGTYILICLSYSLGLFFNTKNKSKKIIFFGLYILFLFGILISNTLSCLVAFLVMMIFIGIYAIINKFYYKLALVILSSIIVIMCTSLSNLTCLANDFIKMKDEIVEISNGNMDDNFGTDRLFIWKETLKIIPDNLVHGIGIDNFYYAFKEKEVSMYNGYVKYDKAHNIYLQTLITEGIFSLISYLLLYCIIVIKGIKNMEIYLVLPVASYLIQGFFNISVIDVAPLFYIALGLLVIRKNV